MDLVINPPGVQRARVESLSSLLVSGQGRVVSIELANIITVTTTVIFRDGVDVNAKIIGHYACQAGKTEVIKPEAMRFTNGLYVQYVIGQLTELLVWVEYEIAAHVRVVKPPLNGV